MGGKKRRENKTLQVKESYLRKVIGEAIAEQNYTTQMAYLAALRDVAGFGSMRLARVIIKANKYLEEIDENRIRVEDIQQMLDEETKVLLKRGK